jgi:hypothetical protein
MLESPHWEGKADAQLGDELLDAAIGAEGGLDPQPLQGLHLGLGAVALVEMGTGNWIGLLPSTARRAGALVAAVRGKPQDS